MPRNSRDNHQLLYRRLPRHQTIDGNRYGAQGELVIAASDGSNPRVIGEPGRFAWASWSPNGQQVASLSLQGVFFHDVATLQTVRRLDREGFFQQLTWSPDGEWLVGVANSFGTGWSVARMHVSTGDVQAINRVDSCTPDWFPNSQDVIFSWRPPGQKGNNGLGWTQLWRADADGRSRQLVYGEDGRHVYGGHVSPDGKYVLFTGNMEEDGDPGRDGAPMALMRLRDGPIIAGESRELRGLHPEANHGPVLPLPTGWEPVWTPAELFAKLDADPSARSDEIDRGGSMDLARFAAELWPQGWLVFSARTAAGDWDLFIMRPDGSDRRAITTTPEFHEAGPRFSQDGRRLLYYRLPRTEPVDNNTYGTFDLVLANADGSQPEVLGNGYAWASWGPDGSQFACLTPKGIRIVDATTRAIVRDIPRRGMVSQMVWSPDGRHLVGTANGLGPYWNIGALNLETDAIHAVSETERFNCTPDWAPDARRIVYARGILPEQPGRAELWMADVYGRERQRLYADPDHHIYGACVSPDGQYLLFTRSREDLGEVPEIDMAIIRWPTSPNIHPPVVPLRLDLGSGWEPHWTTTEIFSMNPHQTSFSSCVSSRALDSSWSEMASDERRRCWETCPEGGTRILRGGHAFNR